MSRDHHHHHKHCIELFAKMSEYLDGELDENVCRRIESHIADCMGCQVCRETLRRTRSIVRTLADRPTPVPETLSKKLDDLVASLVVRPRKDLPK